MNIIQKGIVTLIRSAITGQSLVLPRNFCLADAEQLIVSHQMVGLVYEGAILCGVSQTEPVMNRLFQQYCQIIHRSNVQLKAVEQVMAAFEAKGIDYMPVKGYVMKYLFPKAAMRIMTDADILIRMEQYDVIRPLMLELGYTEGIVDDHALVWESKAIELELHRRLVPRDEETYRYIGEGWSRALHQRGHRYDLRAEDAYIFLFAHLVKHYRRSGIGLRQVVDLWVFSMKYPNMDHAYLQEQLRLLKLENFHENIRNLLAFWFEDAPSEEKTEFISQFIFDSGSWGTEAQRTIFQGYQKARKAGSAKAGRSRVIWGMIFPSAREMGNRYPVLLKAPWLLPVFWPVRWITAMLFRRQNIRACQNKVEQITAERVDSFAEALEYVGLH